MAHNNIHPGITIVYDSQNTSDNQTTNHEEKKRRRTFLYRMQRIILWLITHTFYRAKIVGQSYVPRHGGALLVCNHVSLLDGLFLMASVDRPIRFLVDKDVFKRPIARFISRIIPVIPVSSGAQPRELIRSLERAREAVRRGEIVCVFPEGQITRIGQLLPFQRGFEHILKNVSAPIIPTYLDGLWGSIFSYERGRLFWKRPGRVPRTVRVMFGRPMPSSAKAMEVRQAVQDLSAASWQYRHPSMKPIHRYFVSTARRFPRTFAFSDARVPKLRFGSALTRTIFLAQRLKQHWQGQEMVGILLPPSVAGALVNMAALLMGKVPVNLNYTASSSTLASCARQCGIRTIVSSKAFLDRVSLEVPEKCLLLEEIARSPLLGEKLRALIKTWTLPIRRLEQSLGHKKPPSMEETATIIFSSGSTGDPKGVVLSHFNVVSNVQQVLETIPITNADRILGILPFFHSFGFTATLCLPAIARTGVVFHANPLEAATIGALVQQYAVTFILATPTFLQIYTRGCSKENFDSLRFVVAGAEKLRDRIALAFEHKFGIRPLEGYGCTECAPVVAVNTIDYRVNGMYQAGAKSGKIGRPLPGMSIRIVDPDTRKSLPVHQAGLLLVRGPNVMKGYLGQPEKTADVLQDGWYLTGDIASLDADGFIEITDRLSRFSKIGGEMIPHIKVEDRLHDLSGVNEHAFVVTGVADEKKGERLVVLHTLPENDIKKVLRRLSQIDLPNLWVPRISQFFRIENIPYLGSGKLDLRMIRQLAYGLSTASK